MGKAFSDWVVEEHNADGLLLSVLTQESLFRYACQRWIKGTSGVRIADGFYRSHVQLFLAVCDDQYRRCSTIGRSSPVNEFTTFVFALYYLGASAYRRWSVLVDLYRASLTLFGQR